MACSIQLRVQFSGAIIPVGCDLSFALDSRGDIVDLIGVVPTRRCSILFKLRWIKFEKSNPFDNVNFGMVERNVQLFFKKWEEWKISERCRERKSALERGVRLDARARPKRVLVEQVRGWWGTGRATSRKNKRHNRIVADCPRGRDNGKTADVCHQTEHPTFPLVHPRKVSRSMSHKLSLDFWHPLPPIYRRLSFPFSSAFNARSSFSPSGFSNLSKPFFQRFR